MFSDNYEKRDYGTRVAGVGYKITGEWNSRVKDFKKKNYKFITIYCEKCWRIILFFKTPKNHFLRRKYSKDNEKLIKARKNCLCGKTKLITR